MKKWAFLILSLIHWIHAQPLYTFKGAVALSVDVNENIYVLDNAASSVYKFDKWGSFQGVYKAIEGFRAQDIDAMSGQGIFIADTQNHQIVHLNEQLQFQSAYFPTLEAQTALERLGANSFGCDLSIEEPVAPQAIAIDYQPNFFILDEKQKRILKQDIQGNLLVEFGAFMATEGALTAPKMIAYQQNGTLWVVEDVPPALMVYDGNGVFLFRKPLAHSIENINVWLDKILVIQAKAVQILNIAGRILKTYPSPTTEKLADAVYANGFIWMLTAKGIYKVKSAAH